MSNFQASGSIFKGKTLETYEDFPGLDVTTALRRLQGQLPSADVAIVSVDADRGIIRAENQSPNARPFPLEFTVTPLPSGARVRLWLKMRPGQMITGGAKPSICETIRLASIEPPPPPAPPKPPEAPLTNEEVVKLVQAGLDDEIIIAKIKQSSRAELDISTDALVELKNLEVSDAVIRAMLSRAENEGEASSTTEAQPATSPSAPKQYQTPEPEPVSDELRLAKPLSRGAAQALIAASKEASALQHERFFLGLDFRQSDFIGFGNWKFHDALARTGHIRRQGNRWVLTTKGESAAASWRRDPQRPDARLVPVAMRRILSITGITEAPLDQGMIAEFTWTWVATPIWEEVRSVEASIARRYNHEEKSGEALLKYYDDGWRVQKVVWQ